MFCSLLQALVMLHVLAIIVTPTTTQVDALPITSKPIESTAENLAWQAWIMMPAHQQNLEKSRKVTPKSIFILPNRVQMPAPLGAAGDAQPLTWGGEPGSGGGLYAPIECPPGQRQFESRCISTLDIDRDQLLIQELQVLLQQGGGSNNSNNNNNNNNNTNINSYDYDYDYDEESAAPLIINDPPLVFKSSESPSSIAVANGNYDEGLGLPHQDSPLKFNIFQANFPTNTDAEQNQTQTLHSEKRVANNPDEAQFFHELQNAPNATETFIFEGQKTSTNSRVAVSNTTESSNNTTSNSEPNHFSLGDIDAIILPAASSSSLTRPHHVSILKNDSVVQLLPTTVDHHGGGEATTTTTTTAKKEIHLAIVDLLKVDSLLPLYSSSKAATTTTSATTTAKSTTSTPPSPSASLPPSPPLETTTIQGVTTTETLKATSLTLATTTSPGLTTPLLIASESSEDDVHSKATTIPMPLASLLEEANRHASEETEKDERTRSVTLGITSDETDTNEPETTLDSVPPTTFLPSSSSESTASSFEQLDETTAIERELEAAEEVALLELQHFLEAVQHPREPVKSKQHTELQKSKVEPVAELPANRKHASNDDGDLLASQATPLPTLRDTITHEQLGGHDGRDDREQVGDGQFYYREDEVEVEIAVEDGNLGRRQEVGAGLALKQIPKSTTATATETITTSTEKTTKKATTQASTASTIVTTTTTTTTTTTKPSEIDIAAELRAINELVKSRRQAAEAINKKRIPTAAVTATTAVTATPAIKSTLAISQIVKNSLVSDQDGSTSVTTQTPTKTTDIIKTTDTSTKITETTAATIKATTGTVIASSEATPSVAGARLDADTIEESANATTTTATTPTTDEATATLWSKVMPMLGLGASKTTTTITTTTTTTTPEVEPTKIWENVPQTAAITTLLATTSIITEATTATEPTKAITKNFNKSLTKSFKNSNNRNGEITTSRLDRPKLGGNSFLSDNAKKVTGTSTTTKTTTAPSTTPATPSRTPSTATTSPESSTLESAASSFFPTRVPPFKALPPSEESSSPYWWLPIGWRLDPATPSSSPITANNDLSDDDSSDAQPQSLLLRFWSAFPGNQVKVRK